MKKTENTKSSQTQASAAQDIVGLITTLVERLVSLETKMDAVLSRVQAWPAEQHRQYTQPAVAQQPQGNVRQMYTTVCADCGKSCEVPFKPIAGRSVYCKACYSVRRSKGPADIRPEGARPPAASLPEKPRTAKASAPEGKKKPAAKKAKKAGKK